MTLLRQRYPEDLQLTQLRPQDAASVRRVRRPICPLLLELLREYWTQY